MCPPPSSSGPPSVKQTLLFSKLSGSLAWVLYSPYVASLLHFCLVLISPKVLSSAPTRSLALRGRGNERVARNGFAPATFRFGKLATARRFPLVLDRAEIFASDVSSVGDKGPRDVAVVCAVRSGPSGSSPCMRVDFIRGV